MELINIPTKYGKTHQSTMSTVQSACKNCKNVHRGKKKNLNCEKQLVFPSGEAG